VTVDTSRFRQLLENLFRNAADHAGDGTTVWLDALKDDPGFYVADDGPSIPADRRDRAFERGYTTAEDGSGFGLTIVAEIVTAHGWEVDLAESHEGGARFESRTGPCADTIAE